MKNLNTKTKAWINLFAFIITIAFNALGSFGYINGMSQKAVSDKYHNLITPAPFTFSIWGIIYTLLLLTLAMMIVKKKDSKVNKLINIFTPTFLLSSLFNILWIVSFSYEQIGISTIFIFLLLISLTTISKRLDEHRSEIPYRLIGITFGLYSGWLTIASVVNVAAYLVRMGWNGFGISQTVLAPTILALSIIIVILINTKINNAVYTLPVAWAFFGILMETRRLAGKLDYGTYLNPVIIIGIVVLTLVSILQFNRNNFCVVKREDK